MALLDDRLLSCITFLPLFGAVLILLCMARRPVAAYWTSLGVLIADFALVAALWTRYDASLGTDQFTEKTAWFMDGRVAYHLASDGISLVLAMLTAFLGPLVILSTRRALAHSVPLFMAMVLLLQTSLLGAFFARDMLLFYVFWQLTLVPIFFLIGIWGGARRIYATVKFLVFAMAGSVLMLVAILTCWHQAGSMDLADWRALELGRTEQIWLFAAFALACAVRVPVWPLHTWLVDAHAEAPTAGSVILAGVLLKTGAYGLLRYAMPLFPQAAIEAAPILALLAVAGIIVGALLVWVQTDIKRLIAYSSLSHMGFVILGLFSLTAQGAAGGVFQMLAHGLSTGAFFLLVGIIYERRRTQEMDDIGGLAHGMPRYATVFMIAMVASVGIPGLCGFIAKFMVLSGTFGSAQLEHARWLVVVAFMGIILGAVAMFRMYQRVFLGPVSKADNANLGDLKLREHLMLWPLVVMMFWLGIGPGLVLGKIGPSLDRVLEPVALQVDARAWSQVADPEQARPVIVVPTDREVGP